MSAFDVPKCGFEETLVIWSIELTTPPRRKGIGGKKSAKRWEIDQLLISTCIASVKDGGLVENPPHGEKPLRAVHKLPGRHFTQSHFD
jgi:hypothetical protein